MPRILMPIVPGFEETEAIATIDILRRAGVEVITASDGATEITSAHNITMRTDIRWEDRDRKGPYDALILPGGPGTPRLNDLPGLHGLARTMEADGRLVAAICAAPTVLAKAGVLSGRKATCWPGSTADMGNVPLLEQPVVEDRRVITSRGVGTALDFALAIVAELVGQEKADKIADSIVYHRVAVAAS